MTMDLGSQFVVQNTPGYFTAPNYGLKGLIIANTSPFTLLVYTGLNSKRLYPDTVDWFPISRGFNGTITWYPQNIVSNPSSYTASTISFTAVGILENVDTNVYPMALTLPAVNPTASGDPIFSATVGFGSTLQFEQVLNIFNPFNSGATCTFHSARVFTSDATLGDNALLLMQSGPDPNFTIPVPIQNNSGQSTPTSVCHASAADTASLSTSFNIPNSEVEVFNTTQNQTLEFLSFPDNKILLPNNNLAIAMVDGGAGKVTRLTTKWTEKINLPIIMIAPPPPAKPGGLFMPNLTGIYSPLDYGPITGVANDDVAVRKAYNAAASNGGGWVLMHPLKHVFSSAIQLTNSYVGFWGMGWSGVVTIPNAANFYPFVGANSAGLDGVFFHNFKIDGNGANQTGASGCIDAQYFFRCDFNLMWFEAPYEAGVHHHNGPGGFGFQSTIRACRFMDGALSPSSGMGLWIETSDEHGVENCFFQAMGGAATITGQDKVAVMDANGLTGYTNCRFVNCRGGIKCTASQQAGVRVVNSIFDGCPGYPTGGTGNIVLSGSGGHHIIGNRFLNIGYGNGAIGANTIDGIYISGIDNEVIGNYFNPAGDGHNGCKGMIELDGTSGEDYTTVIGNVFAANVVGSTQILTDGAPTHNQIANNAQH